MLLITGEDMDWNKAHGEFQYAGGWYTFNYIRFKTCISTAQVSRTTVKIKPKEAIVSADWTHLIL